MKQLIQSNKKWKITEVDEQLASNLQKDLHISSIAAKILVSKGITTANEAEKVLHCTEKNLHDPFLMNGMDKAVDRIRKAIDLQEKILIYGDYDADGLSSTSVLLLTLRDLGANVDFAIPNRFKHGYGPNEELFKKAHEDGVQLIVTVDNGISAINQVRLAKDLGMDIIITDHHEPGEVLPEADVIIHPRVPVDHYPFGELAGVGVAFKLAHALYGTVPDHLFEYVAIGTVADLVPLVDENRYIVKKGIEKLRVSGSPWVKALCQVAGVEQRAIDEQAIGFYFGPRLNAVGRLGDADPGVDFFMSDNLMDATIGAQNLNEKNNERKAIVKQITDEAIEMIETNEAYANSKVLLLAHEDWHEGVVGIVASKLVEKYYKPTILLSINKKKGFAKGSGRSIEGFHLFHELEKNRDIIDKFGGHAAACGMTIDLEIIDDLRNRLNKQADEVLTEEMLTPTLKIDIPLSIDEISVEAIEEIRKLAPFGVGFSKPTYVIQNVELKSMRKIGANEDHLKLEIGNSIQSIDAIGFFKGYLFNEMTYKVPVSFVGDLQINEWNGMKKPQFQIEDVKIDCWQLFDYRSNANGKVLQTIPKENTNFIAFRNETIEKFQPILQCEIGLADDLSVNDKEYLAILDLPTSVHQIEEIVRKLAPSRIYAIFHKENPLYFQGIPDRKNFIAYFNILRTQPQFHIRSNAPHVSKHLGLSVEIIYFMTKVFLELGFVKIEEGYSTVNSSAPKRDLEEANVFKERVSEIEVEKTFLYSSYQELRAWFDEQMKEVSLS